MPGTGMTTLKFNTVGELNHYLLTKRPGVDLFRLRGPFEPVVQKDRDIKLSDKEHFPADLYLSSHPGKAPLVIFLHGYENTKETHAYQGLHLATWGLHALVLQVPNKGPWTGNGRALARIVELIRRQPEILDPRIDPERIVLAGHSFGAMSVVVALSQGSPAMGGVLLDPAGFGKDMIKNLRSVSRPIMMVAADESVTRVRGRDMFYEYIRSGIAEVSVRDADHDDAEFPMQPGSGSERNEELQITFVSVLTSAAFSLGVTGGIDYVWNSLDGAIRDGKLYDRLRK